MLSNQELALQVEGLSFEYEVGNPVLWDFDLDVAQGSICGILGRNGSGKTTLLQCLYGMLEPEEGSCRVLGHNPFHEVVPLRQRVGYAPQKPQFDPLRSAEEQLDFMRPFYDGRWNQEFENALIKDFDLSRHLHQKVGDLSLGQQRQLSLVAALAFEPDILILDEPAVSLDAVIRHRFSELVVDYMATPGRTVIMASHMIGELERLADQVVIVQERRPLLSAPIEDLKYSLLCFEATFPRRPDSLQGKVDLLLERWHGNTLSVAAWQSETLTAEGFTKILRAHGAESVRDVEPSLESLFVHLAAGGPS